MVHLEGTAFVSSLRRLTVLYNQTNAFTRPVVLGSYGYVKPKGDSWLARSRRTRDLTVGGATHYTPSGGWHMWNLA